MRSASFEQLGPALGHLVDRLEKIGVERSVRLGEPAFVSPIDVAELVAQLE